MKPRLLFAWGSPFNFDGVIVPLLPRLAQSFEVYVMLVDYHLSPRVTQQLQRWQADGTISGYAIAPEYEETWRLHFFMAAHVRRLRRLNFEYFVSLTMMQVWERYLLACALPPEAVRLCFFTQLTNLLERESLVQCLLEGKSEKPAGLPLAQPAPRLSPMRALRRMAAQPGLRARLDLFVRYAQALRQRLPIPGLSATNLRRWLGRTALPALLVGRTFPLAKHDWFTQIGTDQFDAVAFLDPFEARAHGALFGNPNMFVVEHPAKGNCRCGSATRGRRAILSPLSGMIGRATLPADTLALYRRDLGAAIRESGAEEIHLRPHPRETGKWPQHLVDDLAQHGIPARIVDSSMPIREVICDYVGVVGFVSAALRDARGCCDYAFVVGMVAASKTMFPNPKFNFGAGEGIEWIEEDGTHPQSAFQRRLYRAPKRPTLMELLFDLKKLKIGEMGRRRSSK